MAAVLKEVHVPDIGDYKDIEVIEVLVKPGDVVQPDDSLITLESDKAAMEVPSPVGGTVSSLNIKPGDRVSKGSLILLLQTATETIPVAAPVAAPKAVETASIEPIVPPIAPPLEPVVPVPASSVPHLENVTVPDIGDFKEIEVIEVLVKPGDQVALDDSLITLESDKAAMEVPSPLAGVVKEIKLKPGDRVSKGALVLVMEVQSAQVVAAAVPEVAPLVAAPVTAPVPAAPTLAIAPPVFSSTESGVPPHATPAIRKFARELGVNLHEVKGTGPKQRISREDVQGYVKTSLQGAGQSSGGGLGFGLPPAPVVDFSRFGTIDSVPLSRIQKLSGPNLHRNWVSIPHITQYDEADITDLEAFRISLKSESEKRGIKLSFLPFVMKALSASLKAHPTFNASLDPSLETLILKHYVHIGVAVDTPDGLVVPVVRDVDQKSVFEIAQELMDLSQKARNKKLRGADLEGGCFTISSLGGIGGTAFTPIINAPEVAILGLSKSQMKPVYQEGQFVPRLMLPLSLSYDHRVIDGAAAARFIVHLSSTLADLRRVLL